MDSNADSKISEIEPGLVLFQDKEYLIVNKPHNIRLEGPMIDSVERRVRTLCPTLEKFWLVHQLDLATSGVLCVGMNRYSCGVACKLFLRRQTKKAYLSIVHGYVDPESLLRFGNVALLDEIPNEHLAPLSRALDLLSSTETSEPPAKELPMLNPENPSVVAAGAGSVAESGAAAAPAAAELSESHADKLIRLSVDESAVPEDVFPGLTADDIGRTPVVKVRAPKQKKQRGKKVDDTLAASAFFEPCAATAEQLRARLIAPPFVVSTPLFEHDDSYRIFASDEHGKASCTYAYVLQYGDCYGRRATRMLLIPVTGRRHQLRVHMHYIGHSMMGDYTYSGDAHRDVPRLMLHAWRLLLPFSKRPPLVIVAPDSLSQHFTAQAQTLANVQRWRAEHAAEVQADGPPRQPPIPPELLVPKPVQPPPMSKKQKAALAAVAAAAATEGAILATCSGEAVVEALSPAELNETDILSIEHTVCEKGGQHDSMQL